MPLFRIERHGKAGFIDASGKIIIQPQFDIGWFAEEDFIEGLSPARRGENWGFVNTSGVWVIPPSFWRVEPFSEGLAAVTHGIESEFSTGYVDREGKEIIRFPRGLAKAGRFSDGLAAIRERGSNTAGKMGYIDTTGAIVIPATFAHADDFHGGLAAVIFDGQCYVADEEGKAWKAPPSVHPATSCGGVPSNINKKCEAGFVDKGGNVLFRFDEARSFSEGLAAVEHHGKWGFIDEKGSFKIEPKFERAKPFSRGLAAAKLGDRWGYIAPSGEWVIAPRFKSAEDFSDGFALTNEGFVDRDGKSIGQYRNASAFVQGLAHVQLGMHEYGYIDHTGRVVFRYHATSGQSMLPYSEK